MNKTESAPDESTVNWTMGHLGIGREEALKRLYRLRHDMRDIKHRWNNRFEPEERDLREAYLKGDFGIVINGVMPFKKDYLWFVRISAAELRPYPPERTSGQENSPDLDLWDAGRRDNEVVLVHIAEDIEGYQRVIPSNVRLYIFKNESFKVGQGVTYRFEPFPVQHLFKTLPIHLSKRELELGRIHGGDLVSKHPDKEIIKYGPEVMHSVSDKDCEELWDLLFRPEGVISSCHTTVGPSSVDVLEIEVVEKFGRIEGGIFKRLNVLIGPVGFEPRLR